jgi:hypothetical protein
LILLSTSEIAAEKKVWIVYSIFVWHIFHSADILWNTCYCGFYGICLTGFWFKQSTYTESPTIAFKHELMMVLGLQSGDFVTYSTFQNYNQMQGSRLRIPLITVWYAPRSEWRCSYFRYN